MRNGTKYIKTIDGSLYNISAIHDILFNGLSMNTIKDFYRIGRIKRQTLESIYSGLTLQFLIETEIISRDLDYYYTEFNCTAFEKFVIFSDPDIPDDLQAPLYVDPLWDKYISKLLIRNPVNHSLDMGGGSGIISLVLSTFSKRVTYIDINERAVKLAMLNAALNSVNNITFVQGDLFESISNTKYDYIVFNSPTDKEGGKYVRLLETGEQILERFFGELISHLSINGICQVSMGVYDGEKPAFEKINMWINSEPRKKLYLVAMEEEMNSTIWRRMHLTLINSLGNDKILNFSYNLIPDRFDGNISSSFINELIAND